jgi:hypothetical protein
MARITAMTWMLTCITCCAFVSLDIVLRIDESRQSSGDDNASADSSQPSNNGTGPQDNNASERRGSGGVGVAPSPLDPVFNLLLKKTTQVPLGAFASMQIPVSFSHLFKCACLCIRQGFALGSWPK